MKIDIEQLKQQCPLPKLMAHLGMGRFAVASCKSPFRNEDNASWGIYESRGYHYWKDFGTDEHGDEIGFLAKYLNLDEHKNFPVLVQIYQRIATEYKPVVIAKGTTIEIKTTILDRTNVKPGTKDQLNRLARLRGIGIEGLNWANDRGVLVFSTWHHQEVYGLIDKSGKVMELRRLDGQDFPAFGELTVRKSHAVAGSSKSWPVGIEEAHDYPNIALVEGVPDFLAAHDLILKEHGADPDKVGYAPVGMLAASAKISEDALQKFKGKNVLIYPHLDEAGINAARKWKEQLSGIAKSVRIFDLSKIKVKTKLDIKDLNDLLRQLDEVKLHYPKLEVFPCR